MKSLKVVFFVLSIMFAQLFSNAQSVSVSPTRLYYKVSPGGYSSQKLRVHNNGSKKETFTVNFVNFSSPGNKGKSTIDTTTNSKHGMADWLTASPSFFEVAPGETKDVEILLQLPNTPDANTVRWAAASVKLARENTGATEKGENVTGMAIIPTFSFIIHLFQTPPNVTFKEVVIEKLFVDSTAGNDSLKIIKLESRNTGDAIVDCAPYLDMINLKTGEKHKVKGTGFTMLPGGIREISIALPTDLPKGEYNILAVVDYGSETDIAAKELIIKVE